MTFKNSQIIFYALSIVLCLIGVSGLYAGWSMMTDPSGKSIDLPVEILQDSPFPNFFIPGAVLFAVNGVGQLIGSILAFFKKPQAGIWGMAMGILLIGWILFQVYWIGFYLIIQSLCSLFGAIEIILGIALYKRFRAPRPIS